MASIIEALPSSGAVVRCKRGTAITLLCAAEHPFLPCHQPGTWCTPKPLLGMGGGGGQKQRQHAITVDFPTKTAKRKRTELGMVPSLIPCNLLPGAKNIWTASQQSNPFVH